MDIRKLIPRHKDDRRVIKRLKELSFDEIKPIVPDLLEWLQDINWPISGPVADVLKPFVDDIVPDLIKIFRANDGIWKLWILKMLLSETTNPELLLELERIARFPTRDEIAEEVDIEARVILSDDQEQLPSG